MPSKSCERGVSGEVEDALAEEEGTGGDDEGGGAGRGRLARRAGEGRQGEKEKKQLGQAPAPGVEGQVHMT